jgi:hypothetical protein
MKILITGQAGEEVFPFNNSGPWELFRKEIFDQGHEICENGFSEKADVVIANSFNRKLSKYMNKLNIPLGGRTLIAWEPYVVDRKNYKQVNLNQFGSVYAPSAVWAKKMNAIPFNWPQDAITQEDVSRNWEQRKNAIIMIQGNKFSAVRGEMYSTRRRAIKAFNNDDLILFGTNWNRGFAFDLHKWLSSAIDTPASDLSLRSLRGVGSHYKNYEGQIDNKIEVLKNFKIALVVENSLDFVSEKLFDAVRAGCIVVYVGPNLELFKLSRKAAIQVSPNIDEIKEACLKIASLSNADQRLLSQQQTNALASVSEDWENTRVLPRLAYEIIQLLEKQTS